MRGDHDLAPRAARLLLAFYAGGACSRTAEFGLILLFNVIMFVLIAVPLVGYVVRPERTAEQVAELAIWLHRNGLRVMGALVAFVGFSLVVQGLAAVA